MRFFFLPVFFCVAAFTLAGSAGPVPTNSAAPANSSDSRASGAEIKSASIPALKAAAAKGDIQAQLELVSAYAAGKDVLPDEAESLKWCKAAASGGNSTAQLLLGFMYQQGVGGSTNKEEAVKWFRASAGQGNPAAQLVLGYCCLNGEGVNPDEAEGFKWCRKAAETGHCLPQFALGMAYFGVATKLNGANDAKKRKEFEVEAVKWFRQSAEQGMATAQFFLGTCYQNGLGVEPDLAEAYKWFALVERHDPKDAVPPDLLVRMTPKQVVEGIKRAQAFVPRKLNAVFPRFPLSALPLPIPGPDSSD